MIVKNIMADNLADVATSGSYNDLINKPTIPSLDNYYNKSEIDKKLGDINAILESIINS
jgi:hypothetical protein